MSNVIEVQFRMFSDGEIIAVFPYEIENNNQVMCYSHIGQHSTAIWNINAFTKEAKPIQYQPLLDELRSIGYDNLKVIPRRSHSKYLDACRAKYDERNKKIKFVGSTDDELKEELLRRGYAISCMWHVGQLNDTKMRFYKANNEINGFEYKTMFASVNFSNDGRTPLNIYENETEKINEDDELCIIEKIYMDGQWKRTSILERNIDPSDFTIE